MEIRKARAQEAVGVSTLAAETFPLACPPGMPEEDIRAYIAEHLTSDSFAGYIAADDADVAVAVEGDEYLGYTLVFLGDKAVPDPSFGVDLSPGALISKCYVRPDQHGKGVALQLLDAARADALARGYEGVWLNANNQNLRAQRFYEKHGFEHTGFVHFVVGDSSFRDPVYQWRPAGMDKSGL